MNRICHPIPKRPPEPIRRFALTLLSTVALTALVPFCGAAEELEYTLSANHRYLSSGQTGATVPDVAVDINDLTHVVWKNGREVYYARITSDGKSALKRDGEAVPYIQIDVHTTATFMPRIAVDALGNAHIIATTPYGLNYLRVAADTNNPVVFGACVAIQIYSGETYSEYRGADIAIDPTSNLPVVAALILKGGPPIYSYGTVSKYSETIQAFRLDANGDIMADTEEHKGREIYWRDEYYSIPWRCEPPSVAVDSEGVIHVVWKYVEKNDYTPTDASQNTSPFMVLDSMHGVAWKAGDRMIVYSNSKKESAMALQTRKTPLRICNANDIGAGQLSPAPQIAVDANFRAHVAWYSAAGNGKILYSRVFRDGNGNKGVTEARSVSVSSADAVIPRCNPDLAFDDEVVHVVWQDKRNTEKGTRIYHGAVNKETGRRVDSAEYPLSVASTTDATNPRIAFRPNKKFKEWSGYDGDTTIPAPPEDPFEKTKAETSVNVYDEQITLTATYNPTEAGTAVADDPATVLPGQDGGSYVVVPISANDGFGTYNAVWQDHRYPSGGIALYRSDFEYEILALQNTFTKTSGAWDKTDSQQSLSPDNNQNGTYVDTPIVVSNDYTELLRESNFYAAQGVVADGVTPLVFRCKLPVGEYMTKLVSPDGADSMASTLGTFNLRYYNHNLQEFADCMTEVTTVTVPKPEIGIVPPRTILYLEAPNVYDNDNNVGNGQNLIWPSNSPQVVFELQFFRRPEYGGEPLDMVNDPPYATLRFSIAKPPIMLVHGYNSSAKAWNEPVLKIFRAQVGDDFTIPIDYGTAVSTSFGLKNYFSKIETYNLPLPAYIEKPISFLNWAITLTSGDVSVNTEAPLAYLYLLLGAHLAKVEDEFRADQWAMTRYDVVGHSQGGLLLRMLCSNNRLDHGAAFIQKRSFGRGRFRRVITIGSPHRGSRLAFYMMELAKRPEANLRYIISSLGSYTGILQDKFDPFNTTQGGGIARINQSFKPHPSAKFHLISSMINHDGNFNKANFTILGLQKTTNPQGVFFDTVLPHGPVDLTLDGGDNADRRSDGVVEVASHFAGVNYGDADTSDMLTNTDTLSGVDMFKYAAHAEPLVFWTDYGQTTSTTIANRVAYLLDNPVVDAGKTRFGPFVNYTPDTVTSAGPGNPAGDPPLATQKAQLLAIFDNPLFKLGSGNIAVMYRRDSTGNQYELTPADGLDPVGDVTWSVRIINGDEYSEAGVTLTVDAGDSKIVTVDVDSSVKGDVVLYAQYYTASDELVLPNPIVVGSFNKADISSIVFDSQIFALEKGCHILLRLNAVYVDGTTGVFIPPGAQTVSWQSSNTDVATVSDNGLVTVGTTAGTVTITATCGALIATTTFDVINDPPNVTLTEPSATLVIETFPRSTTLKAEADDSDGTVSSVSFYADGDLLDVVSSRSDEFTYTWNNIPPGTHQVYAMATDNEGATSYSGGATIEAVQQPPTVDWGSVPVADQWYNGVILLSATASDPDGDDTVGVIFQYSLDSTDGDDGYWSDCGPKVGAAPFEFYWPTHPAEDTDDAVWLRVYAEDDAGTRSGTVSRMIKVDNSTSGVTFDPHPGTLDVAIDVTPTITFDNAVTKSDDGEIVDGDLSSMIALTGPSGAVAFSATIDAGKTIITVTPSAPLAGVTVYTLSLAGDFKDSVTTNIIPRSSSSFSTTYGPPVKLGFIGSMTGGAAGQTFDSPVKVAIQDAEGNTVLDNTSTVTIALGSRATLSGTLVQAAAAGVATFSDLSMTETGTYTLGAAAGGLTDAEDATFTIRPGALDHFAITGLPAAAAAGELVDFTVTAYDAYDNIKTDYEGTPTFTSSDTRVELPPTYTFYEAENGTHTFYDRLSFSTPGEQWIKVSDGTPESQPEQITVGNASPGTPTPLGPVDGAFAGLSPLLQADAYDDVDLSAHSASHWQVATDAEFSSIVWDSGEGSPENTVFVPGGTLSQWTDYFWRVRYKDSSGDAGTEWSAWSDSEHSNATFRTGYSFPFSDDFSADLGWAGLSDGGWERGPATAGGGANGSPDPDTDTSDGDGNEILGFNIGGDYPVTMDAAYAVSPPVDCSDQDVVELNLQRWLGVENSDWARAAIEVSLDGVEWETVWANGSTDIADSAWQNLTYDLTDIAAGESTVQIRFAMGDTNQAIEYCGWNIDDVQFITGDLGLAEITLQGPADPVEVGENFYIDVYVQENSAEANGFRGGAIDVDFDETLVGYTGSTNFRYVIQDPYEDFIASGSVQTGQLVGLGGATEQNGLGDGVPVHYARLQFTATAAGTAAFAAEAGEAGFSLTPPIGQIGPWRVQSSSTLNVTVQPATLPPLALVTLEGPSEPVALGNTFDVTVYVKEESATANGFLGGPLDVYFDAAYVQVDAAFDPAVAIQFPFTKLGITSGSVLTNRIDELGGATVDVDQGEASPVPYAVLTFQANAIGVTSCHAAAGESGLVLTSPVGQLDFFRVDYGQAIDVDIRQNYSLTVTNGTDSTGNGNYVTGKTVSISADAPATGKAFAAWTGDTDYLADANSADTTVTMPAANIAVTATYEFIDYALTVTNGSGGTTAHYQDEIEITADDPATGKHFVAWTGDTDYLDDADSATTTVTMPAGNVAVTATYANTNYTLTVNNGSGDTSTAIYNQQIAIAADPAPIGQTFDAWTGDTSYLADANSASTTVTMPAGNVTVTATYRNIIYNLTVTNGTGTTTGTYGQALPIAANAPATGMEFDAWTGDVTHVADANSASTTVTMPAGSVAVTATYRNSIYSLTVNNGTGSDNNVIYQQQIQIAADNPPEGERFVAWTGDTGALGNATSATTTVTMPAGSVTVTATYQSIFALVVGKGTGSGNYLAGTDVVITADLPPEGYEFVQWIGHTDYLDDPAAEATTVTMPAAGVSVVALYSDLTGSNLTEIRLHPGWNIFGSAETIDNPLQRIENRNLVIGPAWGFDGEKYFNVNDPNPDAVDDQGTPWHEPGKFVLGHGYWFYSPAGGLLKLK